MDFIFEPKYLQTYFKSRRKSLDKKNVLIDKGPRTKEHYQSFLKEEMGGTFVPFLSKFIRKKNINLAKRIVKIINFENCFRTDTEIKGNITMRQYRAPEVILSKQNMFYFGSFIKQIN